MEAQTIQSLALLAVSIFILYLMATGKNDESRADKWVGIGIVAVFLVAVNLVVAGVL